MQTLFEENAAEIVEIQQKTYENLTAMCVAKQVSSFTYDDVLNAVYIWSNLMDRSSAGHNALREEERIAYYGFGTPSDEAIAYQDFFALMDKAEETVDADKLPAW